MSENRFLHLQEILDNLQEGIIFHSTDTKILFANKAASVMLELNKEQLLHKDANDEQWEFVDQYGDKLTIENYPINITLKTKKNIQNLIIGKRFPSKTIWLNVNTKIIEKDAEIDYISVTFNDITKLKKKNEQLHLFNHIIQNAHTGITVADAQQEDMPLIYVNPAFEEITGYTTEESLNKNCRYLQAKDTNQEAIETIKNSIEKQHSCEVTLRNYKKDGTLFWNLLNLSPVFDEKNRLEYYVGVQHDITEAKELENKLVNQNKFIQSILDIQANIIIITNGENIQYVNKPFLEFFDVSSKEQFIETIAPCICDLFIENDYFFHKAKIKDNTKNWIEEFIKLDSQSQVVSILNSSFDTKAFKVNVKKFDDSSYILSFSDISSTVIEKMQYMYKAYHDQLTGLYNREYFYKKYKEFIFNASFDKKNILLGMTDIDKFKIVNDTHGHDIGDEVLIHFVDTIKKYTRKDDLIFRWGGEEFVFLFTVDSKEDALKALEHIRKVVELTKFPVVGQKTCSIGATFYQNDESIDETIKRADEAVYEAKNSGRNKVVFL